jgi:hypothetical protein
VYRHRDKRPPPEGIFLNRRQRPGPGVDDHLLQPAGTDGGERPQGVDRVGREPLPRPPQDLPQQLLRHRPDHADQDVPAGVRVRAEGGRRHPGRGGDARLHAPQEEEEEAPSLVGALQEDPAEEGVEQQPRLQLHPVRPPGAELRHAVSLHRGAELLREVLPVQLGL